MTFPSSGADAPNRQVWTTSKITGSPEPPPPVVAERVFPSLRFKEPVDLASTPSLSPLLILEVSGKIQSLEILDPSSKPLPFLDLRPLHPDLSAAYGMTFHPGFATNREFFVCYTLKGGATNGSKVARFKVSTDNPPHALPETEEVLLTWPEGGHNGGCLKFGADGMLYISTGDMANPSPPDPLNTGQDISDLLASILRIDVDHTDPGKPYRIPSDNPFVHLPNARPEVWAYGLRNPWRFSFEPGTSILWAGDVGWELWEMVFRLDHGGVNCGWSIVESRQPVKNGQKPGPTPIQHPITDHSHEEAASITGGIFYEGTRVPELKGAYVYGDWETGRMWALRNRGSELIERKAIANTHLKIVCFGNSRQGELYLLDHLGGGIYWLSPNPKQNHPSAFPHKLSETGLFQTVRDQKPQTGVETFSVASPLWTEGAQAQRWMAIPSSKPIAFTTEYWQQPRDLVPENTVFARTVQIQTHRQQTNSFRRLETQVLHYDGAAWSAYTYRWNKEQTDASLVPAEGDEEILTVQDDRLPGGQETLRWRYHSRTECLRCHNPWNGTTLGFNPVQLLHAPSTSAVETPSKKQTSLFHSLRDAGWIRTSEKDPAESLVNPEDPAQPLESRARSYLHTNCGHCHRDAAGGSVQVRFNIQAPRQEMRFIDTKPVQGTLGVANALLCTSGDPLRSVMLYRLAKSGNGHMPYLGSSKVDRRGLALIAHWIESLKTSDGSSKNTSATTLRLETARRLIQDRPEASVFEKRLTTLCSDPEGALAFRIAEAEGLEGFVPTAAIENVARQSGSTLVKELLEPLLPQSRKPEALGANPSTASILSTPGDFERGKRLFHSTQGLQCQACHAVSGNGKSIGPELTHIGSKFSPAELLRQVLFPSERIDLPFTTWTAETADGESWTGLIQEQSENQILLKDTLGEIHRLNRAQLRSWSASPYSLMPEGLLANATRQDAADLIAYLSALK